MDTKAAVILGRELMNAHGLNAWKIELDYAKRRFGVCRYSVKTIGLSAPLTALNDEIQVRDVILHEVAHALVGPGAGHGPAWKAMARKVGAKPERCYSSDVTKPKLRYQASCPSCGHEYSRSKVPTRVQACGIPKCKRTRVFSQRTLCWTDSQTNRLVVASPTAQRWAALDAMGERYDARGSKAYKPGMVVKVTGRYAGLGDVEKVGPKNVHVRMASGPAFMKLVVCPPELLDRVK